MACWSDSKVNTFTRILGEILEGIKTGTRLYKITIRSNNNGPNIVNIIDVGLGRSRPGSTSPAGMWVLRFDEMHGRAGTPGSAGPHINVNYQLPSSRFTYDPHTSITPGQLQAAESVANFLKVANKILLPLAVAIDVIRMVGAITDYWTDGSFKNIAKTAASIAGGWGGGYLGAKAGAYYGTYAYPGIGTVIGSVVGAILGSVIASRVCSLIIDYVWWQEKPGSDPGSSVADVPDNYGLRIETERSEINSLWSAIFLELPNEPVAWVAALTSHLLETVVHGFNYLFGGGNRDSDSEQSLMVDILGQSRQYTFRLLNQLTTAMIDPTYLEVYNKATNSQARNQPQSVEKATTKVGGAKQTVGEAHPPRGYGKVLQHYT